MNRNPIGIIIVLVLIVAGGWYLLSRTPSATAPSVETPSAETTASASAVAAGATVILGDAGFSPATVTVPVGATVTFVNRSSGSMWVASALHPSHSVYSGTTASEHCPDAANTAFDECASVASGSSFSFAFTKEGTWKYHNHLNASQTGMVIVATTPTDI